MIRAKEDFALSDRKEDARVAVQDAVPELNGRVENKLSQRRFAHKLWRARPLLTWAHRYVGLTLAGFLILVGVTGSLVVWNDELDRVFAADLYRRPPPVTGQTDLDAFTLRERVMKQLPWARINVVNFTTPRGEAASFRLEAGQGAPADAPNQAFADPATGRVTGLRRSADLRDGPKALMGFIYALHENLVFNDIGTLALGVVALIWTLDCFVGFWLTLPPSRREAKRRAPQAQPGKSWAERWSPAWLVRVHAGAYKLNFDLHRAGGLWLWPVLLLFAWSGVSFNLTQVYSPVTTAVLGMAPDIHGSGPMEAPAIGWRQGHDLAKARMAEAARERGFKVLRETFIWFNPTSGLLEYRVSTDRDPSKLGETSLYLDGRTGAVAGFRLGAGDKAGDIVTTWIGDLHEAAVLGLAWRIAVTIIGLAIAVLSITGVVIWAKKRTGRRRRVGVSRAEA